MADRKRGFPKSRVGVVVSDKMDKTAVVRVERRVSHPIFKKIVTRSKRYHVHDEENALQAGDKVRIVETRPMSRLKRWRLGKILEKRQV
ncbi:MAG: 30S ribosomal protein S17 [Candidatus Nitrospinota bacterium M3_3B_026]